MRLEDKKRVAEKLAEELRGHEIIYLTDFTGLNVKAITEFRARLRHEGVGYRVVKNTLMRRALEGLDLPDLSGHLDGPTALVLSESDPVAPARVIKEFAKDHDDRPVIKIGVVQRREVDPGEIRRIADLPSHESLLGSIAGGLTAAAGGMVGAINALMRDIASMIEQVGQKNDAA